MNLFKPSHIVFLLIDRHPAVRLQEAAQASPAQRGPVHEGLQKEVKGCATTTASQAGSRRRAPLHRATSPARPLRAPRAHSEVSSKPGGDR